MKTATNCSLLIPTFKRYGKLYRNLLYLQLCLSDSSKSELLCDVEVLIANGTPQGFDPERKKLITKLLNELDPRVNIRLIDLPGASYFERLKFLACEAKSDLVSLLGDEDLFVFDSLPAIYGLFQSHSNLGSVTGRFINIHGFLGSSSLKLSLHEGWIDDYQITGSAYERVEAKKYIPAGHSSMSYAVMKRKILKDITSFAVLHGDEMTYSGFEDFLNVGQLAMGEMISIPAPLFLRDRTFVDRATNEPDWSDDEKDSKINQFIAKFLHSGLGLYDSCNAAFSALQSLPSLRYGNGVDLIVEIRMLMDESQPYLSNYARHNLGESTYLLARKSWKESAAIAFAGLNLSTIGLKPIAWVGISQLIKAALRSLKRIRSRV